jgi:hypothetical protein
MQFVARFSNFVSDSEMRLFALLLLSGMSVCIQVDCFHLSLYSIGIPIVVYGASWKVLHRIAKH